MTITKEFARKGPDIINGTQDFVVAQAPDFMRQIVLWSAVDAAVGIVIFAAIAALAFPARKRYLGGIWTAPYEAAFDVAERGLCRMLSFLGALGVFLVCGFSVLWNISVLLKVCLAPKLFLLEYFAGLLTRGR